MRIRVGRRRQRETEKKRAVGIGSRFNKAFGLGEEVIQYLIEFKAFSLSPPSVAELGLQYGVYTHEVR